MTESSGPTARTRVLIIVQNLPVPFDRRVWLECQALVAADYDVTVVCPKGKGDPGYQVLDGVTIFKYRPYAPGGGALGFILEYAYSFLATAAAGAPGPARGAVRRAAGLQPAGHLLAHRLVAAPARRLAVRLRPPRPLPRAVRLAVPRRQPAGPPRVCWPWRRPPSRTADHVISTNSSYAEIAMRRGGKAPTDVTVVRTGPDGERLRRRAAEPGLPPRPSPPRRLHRRDGSPGRRRPGRPRGGARGPRAAGGPTSPSPSWAAATATTTWSRCATSWGCRTTWSCPAGCPTRRSSTCCRRPTSGSPPTRRTRSTTSPR